MEISKVKLCYHLVKCLSVIPPSSNSFPGIQTITGISSSHILPMYSFLLCFVIKFTFIVEIYRCSLFFPRWPLHPAPNPSPGICHILFKTIFLNFLKFLSSMIIKTFMLLSDMDSISLFLNPMHSVCSLVRTYTVQLQY